MFDQYLAIPRKRYKTHT